jgi:multiple sugar transport system substrate-binding protein
LVGRIGYALPPAGPTGERRPYLWTWSLAITAASRDKRAARDFIAWAASKPFLLRSAGEGNMNPTRDSTWEDPGFQALTAPWGDFASPRRCAPRRWMPRSGSDPTASRRGGQWRVGR